MNTLIVIVTSLKFVTKMYIERKGNFSNKGMLTGY